MYIAKEELEDIKKYMSGIPKFCRSIGGIDRIGGIDGIRPKGRAPSFCFSSLL